jgi:exosortase/archaeosortase family protein
MFGVPSDQQGTKIVMQRANILLPPRVLNVAEACAGLRSLMTFISVGATVAFLSNRPLWQKVIITLSAIPIAIFCNVMRVAGQGLLDYYVSEQLSQSFAHQMVGLVMLLPAFLLILLVGWLLDQIFIEEVDEQPAKKTIVKKDVIKAQPTVDGPVIPKPPIATAPRRNKLAEGPG